jgi:hypothetical protein
VRRYWKLQLTYGDHWFVFGRFPVLHQYSLVFILAGLNMSPIQRLKKTWEKVNKEKFQILEVGIFEYVYAIVFIFVSPAPNEPVE